MRSVRDCSVAVVGGAGFLGSHLVNYLVEDRGCDVLVIDNLSSGRRGFVHPKAKFVHHDITGSEEYLKGLFRGKSDPWVKPEIQFVFNYAALPYVPDSYARPMRVCDVNFMGALKVINAAQEAGAEAILQVSSAEVYGEGASKSHNRDSISEEAPCVPHSSYGSSKAAIDALVQVRWREAKTPCIALRQFNCVGERETHPYVLPEIISQLSKQPNVEYEFGIHKGETDFFYPGPGTVKYKGMKTLIATVRLGNNSSRDFLYVGDAVRIAVELLERGQFGEVYNLGSERSVKVYDLARMVGEAMGVEVVVEHDPSRDRAWEIWNLTSDNAKIRSVVGIDDEKSVKEGVHHHRSWMNGSTLNNLTPLEEAIRRTVADFEASGRKWAWQ